MNKKTEEIRKEMKQIQRHLHLVDTGKNPTWVRYFELKSELKGRTEALNEKTVSQYKRKKLTLYLDVDGMLCPDFHERYDELEDSHFRVEYFKFLNFLYDQGHKIIIYTSRGKMQKDKVALDLLLSKLTRLGLKYTRVDRTKPDFDFILDDKAVPSLDLLKKMFEKFTGVMFYD